MSATWTETTFWSSQRRGAASAHTGYWQNYHWIPCLWIYIHLFKLEAYISDRDIYSFFKWIDHFNFHQSIQVYFSPYSRIVYNVYTGRINYRENVFVCKLCIYERYYIKDEFQNLFLSSKSTCTCTYLMRDLRENTIRYLFWEWCDGIPGTNAVTSEGYGGFAGRTQQLQ